MVEFQGHKFSSPSKLAVAMVNSSGGKAEALNGYDYLFVKTDRGLVALAELRRKLSYGNAALEGTLDDLMQSGAFDNRGEARKWWLEGLGSSA